MVLINKAINEITVKLVYYGPGLCGKTTNLEKIYANPKLDNKGKMISMATETDRTLFFDFMPMELGTIAGQKVRVQLYTVPGQVFYDATRKLVLRGSDGVVFVADSQNTMRESNLDSLANLRTNLRLNRLDPNKVAIVYQLNKRDLPNVDTVEEMAAYLNAGDAPVVEAAAIQGTGVTATLRAAVAKILDNLKNNVDTTLYEEPQLRAPDMSARSGVTPSSAGTPKLSMRGSEEIGESTIAHRPAPPAPKPPPAPVPFMDHHESPFATPEAVTEPDIEPEVEAFPEADPVAVAIEATVEPEIEPMAVSPFEHAFAPPPSHHDDDPFGHFAAVTPEHETPIDDHDDPFASPSAEVHDRDGERKEVEALLAGAKGVVEALERALGEARAQERRLTDTLSKMH